MSDDWNIALLKATGVVSMALLDIMQERQSQLRLWRCTLLTPPPAIWLWMSAACSLWGGGYPRSWYRGVNDDVLADYHNRNIVVVADALTDQLVLAVKPLTDFVGQSARLLNGLAAEPDFL